MAFRRKACFNGYIRRPICALVIVFLVGCLELMVSSHLFRELLNRSAFPYPILYVSAGIVLLFMGVSKLAGMISGCHWAFFTSSLTYLIISVLTLILSLYNGLVIVFPELSIKNYLPTLELPTRKVDFLGNCDTVVLACALCHLLSDIILYATLKVSNHYKQLSYLRNDDDEDAV